ncbi:MAG: hypothetical protein J6R83_00110, partial [Clostridia bacterium]|nr:hypothetical protein [Clostridia bacterium]
IDCYFEYDLPEGVVFDVNYSGYGQSVGLGVYNTAGNLTKFYNVIINTSKVQIKNADTAYAYGSLMSKANNNKVGGTGSGTWQTVTSDVYVISNYKYLSYSVDSTPTPGSTSGALTGITNISAVWFAENEVELYNAQKDIDGSELSDTVKKIIEGTKRYDSFSDFANAASQNDYASFSTDLWDLSGGFPIFKSALTRFDFYYLGGSATATSAKLSSEGEGESITINANIRGVSYVPTLSIVSGTEFVTIQGNDVKAVPNAFGQAVVKATYNIAGSLVEKEYTINVIGEAWSGNAIRYSTLDSKFFFDAELEQAGVVSVVDANTSAVYYEDGFATAEIDAIANTSGTDLNDYTSNAIITLEDGTQYAIDIVSYTKILTKSSDFALFHSTSGATISGYYIMNNDTMLDGSWNGNSSQSAGVGKVKFTGVFDGNGYVAEIALDSFGVFGVVDGGTIKNTAFIVKSIGNKDFAYATILAQSLTNTTVSDCYFEYDLPAGTTVDYSYYGYGHSAGIGLYNASGVSVKFNNVIINTSKLVMTTGSYSQPFAYGALKSKADNSQYPAYITKTTNTYVISANKYISYYADVLAKDNAITQFLGDKYVWFAANDTDAFEAYNDQVGTIKKLISGTKRYDNETAFAADAENNDYTSFNANIWDTTKGYPVFKTLPAYQLVSDINKSAEYYIGGSNGYEVNLENTNSTGLTVYATYGGETYLPEFEVKSGANLITITENVIKPVANAMGTVELKATYDIEGVIVEKTYTISVTLEQLNGNIMFSTIDNEGAGRIYFPEDNRLDGENIKSVYDLDDSSIVYFDGEITTEIPKNTDSSDLTNYTKTVIVELEDGTIYSTKLISYTKVLTTAEDLLIFNIDDGDAEVKTPRMVEGYYILGGDIVGTAPLTFKHADMLTAWDNTTTGFAGVFDGDGHKVTVTLTGNNGGSEKPGIFGQLQAGAVIKNVAFVDCVIDRGVLLFSGSMNNTRESYVQNVYINMTTTTASTYGGSAWYSPGYINVQGVIIDNDTPASVISGGKTAAEILAGDIPTAADNGHGTLFSNTYALNDASRIKGLIVVSESPLVYGRVSSTTTTSNDTHSHRIAVGVNEGYQSGATIDCPCNTGLLKDHLQIFTISTVYHYASLLELSNNTSDITEIITNYSTDYWNIVNGYPVFKGLEDRVATDMISSTEYYLGGSKGATEVTLENKAETSINVYATFNSADYQPTLSIVEGNTVTVLGNTITVVANAVGNTVVKATYVINGITVEKLYTISVAPEERAGLISYSTLDNKFYLSDEIKNDDIVEIVEPISGDVYFANDQVTDKIPQNTNSKDLTDYTKKVVVKLADGSNYSVTAISYTMVLTTDDDFAVFKGENGSTIAGYYIMANDIKLDGSWTGNTCSDSSPHKFNGVFDGNGHVAEIALKKYGIFGTIVGAENNPAIIKDTAFIVKEIG